MQERQRVRERLPDREKRLHNYSFQEERALRYENLRELFRTAPRVIKYDAVPWEQVPQGYHKLLTGSNLPEAARKLKMAPIYLLQTRLQQIETGHKNGKHRHYPEAVFYILEGKGHEVHDDIRWDWEAGDLVLVPPYCVHQHFCDEGPARMFFSVNAVANEWGLGGTEQIEASPDFVLPEGSSALYDTAGQVVGYRNRDGQNILFQAHAVGREQMAHRALPLAAPNGSPPPLRMPAERRARSPRGGQPSPSRGEGDSYDYYLKLYDEERQWRFTVPHVIKPSERQWEDTRNGRVLYFAHPHLNTGLKTFEVYLQDLPPGGSSGKHLHVGEEIHFIVEGSGYEVIDGERYDWDANDTVAIPVLSTHQSFNRDPQRPARFLTVKSRHYDNLGFGGIEHMEDAGS